MHLDYDVLVVAYSGGLDSQVLLHQCRQALKPDQQLLAVHVHHGLSANADRWQQHCEQTCTSLSIPLHIEKLSLNKSQKNLEAVAREERYASLANYINSPTVALLTAHHQDDQSETLMLQLLRGSGPRGLASMPVVKPFSQGFHLRPLLHWTREQLQQYAQQHQLTWCDDESNTDPRFDRNYLRVQVFPLIKKRWPTASAMFARSAQWCAESSELLDEIAALDFAKCAVDQGLNIDLVLQLSRPRIGNLLRYWLRSLNFPVPDSTHVSRIIEEILKAQPDAAPLVQWQKICVRRFRNTLMAMRDFSAWDPSKTWSWDLTQDLVIPGRGTLTATKIQNTGIRLPLASTLTVRFRQGGERFSPGYGVGSRCLKKCFQDWDVPPWDRDRIPLLFLDDRLIAVVGYAVAKGFEVGEGEEGIIVTCKNRLTNPFSPSLQVLLSAGMLSQS